MRDIMVTVHGGLSQFSRRRRSSRITLFRREKWDCPLPFGKGTVWHYLKLIASHPDTEGAGWLNKLVYRE